jgi:PKD repeat protein
MPVGYQHHAAVVVGNRLVLAGGGQFIAGNYVSGQIAMAYDPQSGTWTTPDPVPSAGGPYAGSAGLTLVFAGSSTNTMAMLPSPLDLTAGTGVGTGLYVGGGWDGSHGHALSTLFAMDPVSAQPLTYSWDFGDGHQGNGQSPSHAYAASGIYTVTLTVSTPDGRSGSATAPVTINAPTDSEPPAVVCDASDGAWHGTDVSIACTTSDAGSGLLNPSDASFSLTTNVIAGVETANAQTNSRSVCDVAGNCATAGPIGGNMIDKRAPTVATSAPASVTYLLNQVAPAGFACTDGGSGVSSCTGSVASGTPFNTSTVGSHVFAVTATDSVGNTATANQNYTVVYNQCVLFDQGKAHKAGSTIPIKLELCDAAGANVSSASVPVVATAVYLVSTSAPGPLADSGNANPDNQFRFAGGSYIFNLSLKGFTEGTYAMAYTAGSDPTTHTVQFQVR